MSEKAITPETIQDYTGPFTDEMWAAMDGFLSELPARVRLVVWASERNSCTEGNAVDLCRRLADRFDILAFRNRPRKADFPYYPVVGVMGIDERGKDIDFNVRFIGHPAWYQINSLVGAIQAVSFRGMTTEATTRIQLSRLRKPVKLDLFTTPENEAGVLMSTLISNLAVLNENVKAYTIMINDFPQVAPQYSVYQVPKVVINDRHHVEGVVDEERMLRLIAKTLKREAETAAA